ncbi:MAG: hypothetical protein OSJ59_12590, partial [Lachnospiraceae bacterium]|nr:hypothetical protein [Lachnospiraceae bacterium]
TAAQRTTVSETEATAAQRETTAEINLSKAAVNFIVYSLKKGTGNCLANWTVPGSCRSEKAD